VHLRRTHDALKLLSVLSNMCHWFSSSSTPFRGVYSLALAFVPIFPVIAGLNVWKRLTWIPRPLTGHASVLSSKFALDFSPLSYI
jgi:hypothetical protein